MSRGVSELSTSDLITVALMKNPNSGGRPPMFINEIMMISSIVECLTIAELRAIDVIFVILRAAITVVTMIMYDRRYSVAVLLETNMAAIIHPMWPIEEYAMIGRRSVWFIPPMPPMMDDVAAARARRGQFESVVCISKKNGAIFCTVTRAHP